MSKRQCWRRPRRSLWLPALLLTGMGALQAEPLAAAPEPLLPASISDPAHSFAHAPVIATLKLPQGWQLDSSLHWQEDTGCTADMAQLRVTAAPATGWPALEITPMSGWLVATSYPQASGSDAAAAQDDLYTAGCLVAAYDGLEVFLRALASQARPQAEQLGYRKLPQQLLRMRERLGDTGEKTRLESGQLLIRHFHQGKAVREALQTTLLLFEREDGSRMVVTGNVYVLRMTEDAFEPELLERIVAEVQPDPAWEAALLTRSQALGEAYGARTIARLEQAFELARKRAERPHFPRSPRKPGGWLDNINADQAAGAALRYPSQIFARIPSLPVSSDGLPPIQPQQLLLAADGQIRETMRERCIHDAMLTARMDYIGANEDSRRQLGECWRRWSAP